MRDLTKHVDSRDCARPSCPNEADGHDRLCHSCRGITELPVDPIPEQLKAMFRDDTNPAALEPTCKHDGCGQPVRYHRGPGAGHCEPHGLELYRANQRRVTELRKQRGSYRGNGKTNGEITSAARTVLATAKQLDAAIAGVYQAEQRRDQALGEFRRSLTQLVHTVRKLTTNDAADRAA